MSSTDALQARVAALAAGTQPAPPASDPIVVTSVLASLSSATLDAVNGKLDKNADGGLTVTGTSGFWSDDTTPGTISRMGGRVFIGAATANGGKKTGNFPSGYSWLDVDGYMGYFSTRAQLANISVNGGIGYSTATRTSDNLRDAPAENNTIGFASYARNDRNDASNKKSAWAFYGAAIQRYGNRFTTAQELDVFNLGPEVAVDPYQTGLTGTTAGSWIAAGGEAAQYMTDTGAYDGATSSSVNPASVALGIVNNTTGLTNAAFRQGIVFGANAIMGTDGATGTGSALQLAKGHEISWKYSGGTNAFGGKIRSDGVDAAGQQRIVFDTGAFRIKGVTSDLITETTLFAVTAPTLTSGQTDVVRPVFQPGLAGTGIATLVASGADANADMVVMGRGTGGARLRDGAGADKVRVNTTGIAFNGMSPVAKPTVTGSRGGNAALASLLTALASYGLIIDGTTA